LFNLPPSASFTVGANNLTATFTDISTDPNFGTAIPDSWTYAWDFGDGATTTATSSTMGGNNITHAYAAAGTYTVSLVLTDAYGATASTTASVIVSAPVVTVSGGGGGGGGGGGNGPVDPLYFVYPRLAATTTATTTYSGSGGAVVEDTAALILELEKKLALLKAQLAEARLALLSKGVTNPKLAVTKPKTQTPSKVVMLSPRKEPTGITTIGTDTNTSELANVSEATKGTSWFQKIKEFVKKVFAPKKAEDN
jgi:PKD repeat protein